MNRLTSWGMDVASVGIRAVKLGLDESGAPRLIGWDVVDFTEDVEDPQSIARFGVIARAMVHVRQRQDFGRCQVWVSLRSEGAFHRTVTVPAVDDQSLDRLLDYEAQQEIPYPLEEVFWDRRVLEIDPAGHVRVAIYALKRSLVEDRLRKLSKMGCPVDGLQLRALALQNFCAHERLLDPGTVVVDVDYSTLTILVHDGMETWFYTMPLGGFDLVQRVRSDTALSHKKVVDLLLRPQEGKEPASLAEARREVAELLSEEISSRIRFFCGARPEVVLENVVLFHAHACVPPLQAALKRALGLPVHVPRGFRNLEVDPGVVTAGIQEHFPSLAKAVGLALQGLGKAEVEVKLFDPMERRDTARRRWTWVASVFVLLAILGALSWRAERDRRELAVARIAAERELREGEAGSDVFARTSLAAGEAKLGTALASFSGLDGDLAVVADLWTKLGAWQDGEGPRLVGLSLGQGSGPSRLVLAWPEGRGGTAAAERILKDFARSLRPGRQGDEWRPAEAWSAGDLSKDPVAVDPLALGLLRRTWRHQAFTLVRAAEGAR